MLNATRRPSPRPCPLSHRPPAGRERGNPGHRPASCSSARRRCAFTRVVVLRPKPWEEMGMKTLVISRIAAAVLLVLLVLMTGAAAPTAPPGPGPHPPNAYAIGIGDVLEISVWKNPDLSATVPVRPDGRISMPLLGDVQAAGMTPLALRQMLTDGLKEFVTAPGVSVVVKEINSQKVFVT